MTADIIAYIAGVILMISFIPQIIKTKKTKKVDDLSLTMLLTTFVSSTLYEIYSIMLNLIPVIIMNGIFTLSILFQIFLKFKYGKLQK